MWQPSLSREVSSPEGGLPRQGCHNLGENLEPPICNPNFFSTGSVTSLFQRQTIGQASRQRESK